MATTIHPTAIIEPGAQLGVDCEIQAYAVVTRHCVLGDRVVVHPFAVIGGDPQYLKFDRATNAGVRVGAGTVIREHVTINRSIHAEKHTVVGENCFLMAASHVAHDCEVGSHVVFANAALLAGHVSVGDHTFLGGGSAVHQFCRVGRLAMVGGHARVVQDVPPYMLVDGQSGCIVGLNIVGLRRSGHSGDDIAELKNAYRVIYRRGLPWKDVLETLRAEFTSGPALHLLEFLSAGTRGFAQERRTPPAATLRLRVPDEDASTTAAVKSKAG